MDVEIHREEERRERALSFSRMEIRIRCLRDGDVFLLCFIRKSLGWRNGMQPAYVRAIRKDGEHMFMPTCSPSAHSYVHGSSQWAPFLLTLTFSIALYLQGDWKK